MKRMCFQWLTRSQYLKWPGFGLIAILCLMAQAAILRADTIAVTGSVIQSVADGTGPAINNPGLNSVLDGDAFNVVLSFEGSVTNPGSFDLTGLNVIFRDALGDTPERGFDSGELTVAESSGFAQFSLFGCLRTGAGCNQGNELDLNFLIPSGQLQGQVVPAVGNPNLLPFDLLEDDGTTDIHGSIASYSYFPASATPEPEAMALMGAGLLFLGLISRNKPSRGRTAGKGSF